MPLASLPSGVVVFRLFPRKDFAWPPGAAEPLPGYFSLTDDDRADGEAREILPLFSVWQSATSVDEAKAIRAHDADSAHRPAPSDADPLYLDVDAVKAVEKKAGNGLRCVADPRRDLSMSGADGHAGIEGLHYTSKKAPEHVKWYRSSLVRLAKPSVAAARPGAAVASSPPEDSESLTE